MSRRTKPLLQVQPKAVRDRLGLSQDAFGRLIGVHRMTVSKWELGHLLPEPPVYELLEAFSISRADLSHLTHRLALQGRIATLAHLLAGAGLVIGPPDPLGQPAPVP